MFESISVFTEKLSTFLQVFFPLVIVFLDGVRLVGIDQVTRLRAPSLDHCVTPETENKFNEEALIVVCMIERERGSREIREIKREREREKVRKHITKNIEKISKE